MRLRSRNRVISSNRWTGVPFPWQMQWVRLGYSIISNGWPAATRALTSASLFW